MGMPVRAVGFSTDGSSITNTTVFVDLPEFARIHDDRVSYVLAASTQAPTRTPWRTGSAPKCPG